MPYDEKYEKELEEEKSNIIPFDDQPAAKYFNKNGFVPSRLAEEIDKEMPCINNGQTLYVYQDGVYRPGGQLMIRQIARQRLGEEFRRNRVVEVIYSLESKRVVDPKDLNNDTRFINVQNGLVEWQTGKLHPHSPEHLSTIQLPIHYDPKAKAPVFDEFLKEVVPEDTIPLLTDMMGHSLIAKNVVQKAVVFLGAGSNGKSVLLNVIQKLIGHKNVSSVPLQDFQNNRFKTAGIYGKLANICGDLSAKLLDGSENFKRAIGGDELNAEEKGKQSFDFYPFAQFIFSANKLPASTELGHAFFRRFEIVPFPRTFTEEEQDHTLTDRMTTDEEMSGIFNHALEGLRRVMQTGEFTFSPTSQEQVEKYRKNIDNVVSFVENECIRHEGATVERKKLFETYREYCEENGFKSLGRNNFNDRLRADCPEIEERRIVRGGKHHFIGIGLKAEEIEPEEGDLKI